MTISVYAGSVCIACPMSVPFRFWWTEWVYKRKSTTSSGQAAWNNFINCVSNLESPLSNHILIRAPKAHSNGELKNFYYDIYSHTCENTTYTRYTPLKVAALFFGGLIRMTTLYFVRCMYKWRLNVASIALETFNSHRGITIFPPHVFFTFNK